jgi:predicted MFS family arabinose efflux permease
MTEAHDNRMPGGLVKAVPLLVAAVAVPTFVAFWIGGQPELGLAWAAVSVAFGAALALGSRSDTLQLLRGADDDERALALEQQAMTVVAVVLTIALAGLFLADAVRGETGLVYGILLVVAEATHVAALAVLNRRG